MPTRLDVLLQRRKSAAAELFHRHITASASAGVKPAVTRAARALSVLIESDPGSSLLFDAFSSREPVSTSLENALGGRGDGDRLGSFPVKLYQLIDDFAWGTRAVNGRSGVFGPRVPEFRPSGAVCTAIWKNRDSYPSKTGILRQNSGIEPWTILPERNWKQRFFGASSRICAPAAMSRTSI